MARSFVLGAVLFGAVLLGVGCGPQPDYAYCSSAAGCQSNTCALIHAPTTMTCATNFDCASGTICDTSVSLCVISGHQCTRTCTASAECGSRNSYGAACLMIAADPRIGSFYCYQGCASDFDCPGTGQCTPVTGGAVGHVCFPSD